MTLREVFQSMNLTSYDLTVDMLDVHAVSSHSCNRLMSLCCKCKTNRGTGSGILVKLVKESRYRPGVAQRVPGS